MSNIPFISILNERFSMEEIPDVAKEKLQQNLSDWEREFYSFSCEWFNEKDFVEVKTSGSTGEPKSIQLPKKNMQKSAVRTILYFGLKRANYLLQSLSSRYIAGKMMFVRALIGEMNLMVVEPSTNFGFLDQEKYDFGAVVPLQLNNILETENGNRKVENIRHLLVGGSAIPVQLEQKIRSLKNNIVSTYGMTETASHIAVRSLSGSSLSENYRCLPGISIRKNSGGCLEILAEGQKEWLTTTDLVEIVSSSEFKIIGRADHVVISGGLKFHPEQLEQKLGSLIQHPFMISSEPDEKLGERLILVVEGVYSMEMEREILQKAGKLLSGYEQPKKIVFVNQLPRNKNGKIIRDRFVPATENNANSLKNMPSATENNANSLKNMPSATENNANSLENMPSATENNANSLKNIPSAIENNANSLENIPSATKNMDNSLKNNASETENNKDSRG